jgi:hypothetical protein
MNFAALEKNPRRPCAEKLGGTSETRLNRRLSIPTVAAPQYTNCSVVEFACSALNEFNTFKSAERNSRENDDLSSANQNARTKGRFEFIAENGIHPTRSFMVTVTVRLLSR